MSKDKKTQATEDKNLATELGLEEEAVETEIEETEEAETEVEEELEPEEEVLEEETEVLPEPKKLEARPFRRMEPTRPDPGPAKKERSKPSYKPVTKQKKHAISGNPALLVFPTDRYGVTKDIKTAMIRAASRIAGDTAKKALVLEVVDILLKHIEHKFVADNDYRAQLAARAESSED